VHWKYARGKLEAERAAISQSEVRWTILRPPVVYGPYDVTDRGFWYLRRLMKGGPLALANGGANSFRLVYSRDVAKATVAAAERDQAIDRIYNISQGEILTLRNFIEDSAIALGVQPKLVNAPLELLGELAGPYATMVNLVPDINAAVHDLGYKPTPWSEWAASTAQWFREHWKGDEAKLLESRPRELAFLEKWEKMLESWKR
jgi:nucleoside-diphosphate-sugar epimerase